VPSDATGTATLKPDRLADTPCTECNNLVTDVLLATVYISIFLFLHAIVAYDALLYLFVKLFCTR
jgi:hypothetical protein